MKFIKLYSLIIIISLLVFSACSIAKPKETSNDETNEGPLMEGDVKIEEMTQKQKLQLPYKYGYEYLYEDLNELEEITFVGDYAIMRVVVLNEPRENYAHLRHETITKVKVLEIYKKCETLDVKEGDTIKLREDYWIVPDADGRLLLSSFIRGTPLENNKEYIVFTRKDIVEQDFSIYYRKAAICSANQKI